MWFVGVMQAGAAVLAVILLGGKYMDGGNA